MTETRGQHLRNIHGKQLWLALPSALPGCVYPVPYQAYLPARDAEKNQ